MWGGSLLYIVGPALCFVELIGIHSGMLGLLASAFAEDAFLREFYENVCSCQELSLPHEGIVSWDSLRID